MGYMHTFTVWQILFPECDELLVSMPVLITINRVGGRNIGKSDSHDGDAYVLCFI